MILISKNQRNQLEKVGLIHIKKKAKYGKPGEDQNFIVVNRQARGAAKHYYVTESFEILAFLEMFDRLDLQIITKEQLEKLKESGLVKDTNIQNHNEYVPNSTVYIDKNNVIRCRKIGTYMKCMGFWK